MLQKETKNILNEKLQSCCTNPLTGFFRDGFCNTSELDNGTHVVCSVITDDFLKYTKSKGNDLSSPMIEYNFPGLNAGDTWCLCVNRWKEAYDAGVAPPIKAKATHIKALQFIKLEIFNKFRVD